MDLQNMYPAAPSLNTALLADIDASAEEIAVTDLNFFPSTPNYATIGMGNEAEVIIYNGKDENTSSLTGCIRGQSGTLAAVWQAGEIIYHSFTSNLMNIIQQNIINLNQYTESKFNLLNTDSLLINGPEMRRMVFRGKNLGSSL
ncbi:MAG: hypothetical protein LBC56_04430, partial [Oscillospiraceae bacterium]|nr:hypothetical protein [Oscillospiraceae bacterium]